jgi:hypothetical protein
MQSAVQKQCFILEKKGIRKLKARSASLASIKKSGMESIACLGVRRTRCLSHHNGCSWLWYLRPPVRYTVSAERCARGRSVARQVVLRGWRLCCAKSAMAFSICPLRVTVDPCFSLFWEWHKACCASVWMCALTLQEQPETKYYTRQPRRGGVLLASGTLGR